MNWWRSNRETNYSQARRSKFDFPRRAFLFYPQIARMTPIVRKFRRANFQWGGERFSLSSEERAGVRTVV
jgi:hypothetical protein